MLAEDFASLVKRLRRERGLSQDELSRRLRLSRGAPSQWERCKNLVRDRAVAVLLDGVLEADGAILRSLGFTNDEDDELSQLRREVGVLRRALEEHGLLP